jgi:23S rRNA (cytidine1920-2'-O)/16S rRNA (cytidine1409-2'-O)-methyltransferase
VSPLARVDAELVRRGLARSRGQATELIRAGRVRVDGTPALKPAQPVEPDTPIDIERLSTDADVGRGAAKLRLALADLAEGPNPADPPARRGWRPLVIAGRRAIDVGASTGGFTQVLLEAGASSVLALDVGHGQLARSIADDPRVDERSGVNVRQVDVAELGGPFDLLVADLSFISLTVVMPALAALAAPGADLLLLVKPQFEIGRDRLGADGVVRSEQQRQEAVDAVRTAAQRSGLSVLRVVASGLTGASGNVEYFLWAVR